MCSEVSARVCFVSSLLLDVALARVKPVALGERLGGPDQAHVHFHFHHKGFSLLCARSLRFEYNLG